LALIKGSSVSAADPQAFRALLDHRHLRGCQINFLFGTSVALIHSYFRWAARVRRAFTPLIPNELEGLPPMNKFTIALASAATLAIAACAEPAEDTGSVDSMAANQMANDMAAGTVVEVAQGNEDFSTLVAAVTAAGLGETLSGEGPFTVFAPTNDAFAKIPAETLTELTTNDTETLGAILTYHVVAGNIDAATLTQAITDAGEGGYSIETVGGGTLTASIVDGNVVLTDAAGGTATVTATDVAASNGMIHVIDTVMMPG
jgi:uncharacterized surface protein with fasciclin (FAS1) repeats